MKESLITEKRFEPYRFQIWPPAPGLRDRLKLFRGDEELEVEQRSLEVLEQLLADEPQKTMPKKSISRAVWGGTHMGDDTETHIHALREALADDAKHPRFIATVRGEGYKFLVKWEEKHLPLPKEPVTGTETQGGDIPRAFDEFFGSGISTHEHDGLIIVQSDLMDDVLQDEGSRREITESRSRLYKARTWASAWDVFGATVIQQEFQKHGMKAPRLFLSDHHVRDPRLNYSAFKISMGLGFTDETTKAIESKVCGPWMHISKTFGDAVSLHKSLLPDTARTIPRLLITADDKRSDFRLLFPVDWDSTYVNSWFRMLPPINGPEVRDYAVIFRHTRLDPHRQVLFVVAGFTERSTAIAARYLVRNWITLWKNHVRGCFDRGTRGDFLMIIEGPSDPQCLLEWSEAQEFRVTPEKLKAIGIDCEWARRPQMT